jgi:hypothetical protein
MPTTEDFLRRHPLCCFCGGSEPATTIDRQPAKIVFPDKLRPQEMEFPACASCHEQTSADEALLALVCRSIGSPEGNLPPDLDLLRHMFTTVRRRFPGLLEKMDLGQVWSQQGGRLVRKSAANVNQLEVGESMCRIAAKLALAVYYQDRGAPAATTCRIKTLWAHRQNLGAFQQVTNVIRDLPEHEQSNLKTGGWESDESFFLTSLREGGKLASMVIFHEAVALIALLEEGPVQAEANERWDFLMAPVAKRGIGVIRV